MKRVRYVGPIFDHSGYAAAARNYVLALHAAGVPVSVEPHCFEPNPPPIGTEEERQIFLKMLNNRDDFDVLIVHLTPDLAPQYINKYPGKYIVSYTVWETSKLHPKWVDCCNKVNEIWVPSQWNVESFKNSGVEVPVYKIHHGINANMYSGVDSSDFGIGGIDKNNTFVFTSVMQWNARKNPEGLLRAYLSTFRSYEPVRLVLKAYVGRGLTPVQESKTIRGSVAKIKNDMLLPDYPAVSLITSSLSAEQMKQLYLYGDAYISLTHGEGFGLTMFEAGLAGKPVIATDKGGNMEYMTGENSYLVPSQWDLVYGMSSFNPWYLGDQQWATPSLAEAGKLMRQVYENREEAAQRGALLQKNIIENFNWKAIANQMIERLEKIDA